MATVSQYRGARLLSPKEVAETLGVSVQWVLEHSNGKRSPQIARIKLGKAVRFRPESIEAFIDLCSSAAKGASRC